MTVANIHLLQLAPTSSSHSLSSPCTLFVSLICFIPSNLASAVPLVPLLAVCVWKTESCVCLGMCRVQSFIQSAVSWVVLFMMCCQSSCVYVYMCVCVIIYEQEILRDWWWIKMLLFMWDWLFWVFGSWLLEQSHLSKIDCVTETVKDLMFTVLPVQIVSFNNYNRYFIIHQQYVFYRYKALTFWVMEVADSVLERCDFGVLFLRPVSSAILEVDGCFFFHCMSPHVAPQSSVWPCKRFLYESVTVLTQRGLNFPQVFTEA